MGQLEGAKGFIMTSMFLEAIIIWQLVALLLSPLLFRRPFLAAFTPLAWNARVAATSVMTIVWMFRSLYDQNPDTQHVHASVHCGLRNESAETL